MSYNKNTIRRSEIDKTIELLKEFKTDFKLTTIGVVTGYGLNDDYAKSDKHEIRKLEYNDFVILEQMVRNKDCDMDDIIISIKFKKDKLPKKWKIEKTI